jgi:hypothetical protein
MMGSVMGFERGLRGRNVPLVALHLAGGALGLVAGADFAELCVPVSPVCPGPRMVCRDGCVVLTSQQPSSARQ